ncbi:MAG: DNA replication/repair protein RecF [Anaerolineae bacterium]|nr:DNA replication/repair protein RecF [Anaerolineae bacterium]
MHITRLSLTNFRNYGRLELDLPVGPSLIHGNNAQGKTNLLEAVYYLATTKSPHADQDQQLINWVAMQAEEPVIVGRLVAQISTSQGVKTIEMRLIYERSQSLRNGRGSFRREALVDKRKVRLMDLLGHLRVVMFLPEDVQLITGSPRQRRRYLDITLCQIDPLYCRTLSNYNKVLEQRNALLRQIAEGQSSRAMLPIYTEKLVKLGSRVLVRRARFVDELAREVHRIHYEALTEGRETVRLHYLPGLWHNKPGNNDTDTNGKGWAAWWQTHSQDEAAVAERFDEAVETSFAADLARGATSVGPHRDDWQFLLNGRSLSSYGSRGQQRTAILALKMAEINWMTGQTGEVPILLLDEVVAELDAQRRALLLDYVKDANQAFLTATDPAMFSLDFLRNASSFLVENGRVQLDTGQIGFS